MKSKKWTSAILTIAALAAGLASVPLIYAAAPPDHPRATWIWSSAFCDEMWR